VLLALAGIASGLLELWMGYQPLSGTFYALLPVLAVASLVLMAAGLAALPARPGWAAGFAAFLPLLLHLVSHSHSALLPVVAVLAGLLTWVFGRVPRLLPLAFLANLVVLGGWIWLAAENVRAFWPREEGGARRPFALLVLLVVLLLSASAVAAASFIRRGRLRPGSTS